MHSIAIHLPARCQKNTAAGTHREPRPSPNSSGASRLAVWRLAIARFAPRGRGGWKGGARSRQTRGRLMPGKRRANEPHRSGSKPLPADHLRLRSPRCLVHARHTATTALAAAEPGAEIGNAQIAAQGPGKVRREEHAAVLAPTADDHDNNLELDQVGERTLPRRPSGEAIVGARLSGRLHYHRGNAARGSLGRDGERRDRHARGRGVGRLAGGTTVI